MLMSILKTANNLLRDGNILKYHMEVKNMLLFHYYIMKMNYF